VTALRKVSTFDILPLIRQHPRRRLRFLAAFACSSFAAISLFRTPPAYEHVGYLVPGVMAASLFLLHGVAFVASRLERPEVSSLEVRARRFLFAAKRD
jgi:hypothetical protein